MIARVWWIVLTSVQFCFTHPVKIIVKATDKFCTCTVSATTESAGATQPSTLSSCRTYHQHTPRVRKRRALYRTISSCSSHQVSTTRRSPNMRRLHLDKRRLPTIHLRDLRSSSLSNWSSLSRLHQWSLHNLSMSIHTFCTSSCRVSHSGVAGVSLDSSLSSVHVSRLSLLLQSTTNGFFF